MSQSLKVMQASLDRYLCDKGCTYSILKDSNFTTSRKVLNGKAIDLQEQGMGKVVHVEWVEGPTKTRQGRRDRDR